MPDAPHDGRPTHIDIPHNAAPTASSEDAVATSPTTSSLQRPAPSRGILKNPLRRPSYLGDGDVAAKTDEERQAEEGTEPRQRPAGEQSVHISLSKS